MLLDVKYGFYEVLLGIAIKTQLAISPAYYID